MTDTPDRLAAEVSRVGSQGLRGREEARRVVRNQREGEEEEGRGRAVI